MNLSARTLLLACSLMIALLGASPAFATFQYTGDPFVGSNFTFDNVQETTQLAVDPTDPEPLWGDNGANAPAVAGDQLFFSPPAFTSSSTNGVGTIGATDNTLSLLEMDIISNAIGTPINAVRIDEFGDSIIIGGLDASTGTFASISGVLTVHEINGVAVPAQSINIAAGIQVFFAAPGNIGANPWQLTAIIDVASVAPGATRVSLDLNNTLSASSVVDSTAIIQKKTANGVIITPIPEPSSLALIAFGLFGAVLSGRHPRK
jgi:hypothetical protein